MAGPVFFPNSWVGKQLDFDWPQPSGWKMMKKVMEYSWQLTLRDVEDPLLGGPNVSFAVAVFLCNNLNHPGEEAYIKVCKQVPHHGTEFESQAARSAQVGVRAHPEIEIYKLFLEKEARHLPICLGYKMEHQGDHDPIPGGYVHYVTYKKLPGLHIDEMWYWSLRNSQRKAICAAFLSAYRELLACGMEPTFPGLDNLLWNEEEETIYIINFDDIGPITPEDDDDSVVFVQWGLVKP